MICPAAIIVLAAGVLDNIRYLNRVKHGTVNRAKITGRHRAKLRRRRML